ncbi:MAG: 5-formyltetrahydrofolate cyclo-ligase [Spirochaetaceae bacterium]|nr:MAG: 5-formyltetrahydrofolate cyclo-ligase [Spirochaetaceae bacterium]
MTIAQKQNEIRRLVAASIANLPPDERQRQSHALCSNLAASQQIKEANTVCIYKALPDEVSLLPLISMLPAGVQIATVDHDKASTAMWFIMDDGKRFQINAEPANAEPANTVIIVPGRAFSFDGGRIGRGKGYYDRFLAGLSHNHAKVSTIGAGFDQQIFPRLPLSEHDYPLQAICSAKGWHKNISSSA